jgi:phosphate transport system substrate-binding protein
MRARAMLSALATVLTALLLLGAGAGCSLNDGDDGVAGSALAGRIDVDGSSTLEPFTALAAERFQNENPRVAVVVSVSPSRTGGGFERFCGGETDLSTASRRIEDEEEQACRSRGIEYVEFQVANDAVTVVVNPENDWVDCLTTSELEKIWEPGSEVDSWSEVSSRFPPEELELFGASNDSGTFDYFTAEIIGEERSSRSDYTANEDDFATAQGVAEAMGGLGYFGFYYFGENQDRLKALEIDDGSGCVAPSVETVQSGEYAPLSRPLYVYAKKAAFQEPSVRAFLTYALENAIALAEDALLVPVTDAQLRREQAKFQRIQAQSDSAAAAASARAANGSHSRS